MMTGILDGVWISKRYQEVVQDVGLGIRHSSPIQPPGEED